MASKAEQLAHFKGKMETEFLVCTHVLFIAKHVTEKETEPSEFPG